VRFWILDKHIELAFRFRLGVLVENDSEHPND
jgi:hypothetical protein